MTEQAAENVNQTTRLKTRALNFYSIHRHIPYVSGVILAAGIAFLGGMRYQQHHVSNTPTPQVFAAHTEPQNIRNRITAGTVKAVSEANITVQDMRSNASSTYTITKNTTITNRIKSVQPSDIKVGDTVAVRTISGQNNDAARIIVSSTSHR